jgi:transposase
MLVKYLSHITFKTRSFFMSEGNISQTSSIKIVNPDTAGIDIGASSHFVAVPEGRDKEIVKEFECYTPDIEAMIFWLKQCKIKSVVMESTGSYWIPVFEMLDKAGFKVELVDAHHVKNVRGRKSDVIDCQWLQQLHAHGLLSAAFRPEDAVVELRSYIRQRSMLIETAAMHVQHMQKALIQMNLHLHNAISDITGVTGMAIIRAILSGERDPHNLAKMRDSRCKQPEEVIRKSLQGNYRAEHVFALKQALESYDFYQKKVEECDEEIKKKLTELSPLEEQVPAKPKKTKRYEYTFNVADHLKQLIGADLTTIPGIDASTALKLISEIGTDIKKWPTEKHFCSWLGLCPGTRISGGRRLSSHTSHRTNKAAVTIRMAASCLYKSKTAFGAHLRKMKARMGPVEAVTATANKMARAIYYMMLRRENFKEAGADFYDKLHQEKTIKFLKKRAESLGYVLEKIA